MKHYGTLLETVKQYEHYEALENNVRDFETLSGTWKHLKALYSIVKRCWLLWITVKGCETL